MVGDNTNLARSPLLPLRHEQDDLFVCDIFDAVPKGDAASMEHPVFSLATKPDTKIRTYESADGKSFVKVTPSVEGLATVFDRDILIYCISQVMAGLNRGRKVSKTLQIRAHDMQLATNRGTDGRGYEQLRAALERLKGTTISTNITTGGEEQFDTFGLIDKASVKRKTRDGRMQEIEITLSDWVFNAIRGEEVLTLNRQYFQLRKPLERRLYELARKHCGQQRSWQIGLEKLHAKTGSSSTPKEFKRMVSAIIDADREHDHMPDYGFELEGGIVTVRPKAAFTEAYTDPTPQIALFLKPETYDQAREAAPGWDIHGLEQEWRSWMTEPPRNADAAFIGFCRKWFERRGRP
jgi:plasmid replication initiation protein